MNLKIAYYYIFYKLYKFIEWSPSIYSSYSGAVSLLMLLEIWTLFSINNYWDVFIGKHGTLTFISFKVLFPITILLLLKWIAFWKDDKWKAYVKEFEQLPKRKNIKGSWIVAFITLLCFANFVFSFYFNP